MEDPMRTERLRQPSKPATLEIFWSRHDSNRRRGGGKGSLRQALSTIVREATTTRPVMMDRDGKFGSENTGLGMRRYLHLNAQRTKKTILERLSKENLAAGLNDVNHQRSLARSDRGHMTDSISFPRYSIAATWWASRISTITPEAGGQAIWVGPELPRAVRGRQSRIPPIR